MQIEITPKLLADLKEKAKKATAGPLFTGIIGNHSIYTKNELAEDTIKIGTCTENKDVANNANYMALSNPAVMLALIAKIEQLEKEADYLAERLNIICKHEVPDVCAMLDVTKCPFFQDGQILRKDEQIKCKCEPTNWRIAARDIVKANESPNN